MLKSRLGLIDYRLEWPPLNQEQFLAGFEISAILEKSLDDLPRILRNDVDGFGGGGFADLVEIDGDIGGGDGGGGDNRRGHGESALGAGAIAAGEGHCSEACHSRD